jgi:hypothetical protein
VELEIHIPHIEHGIQFSGFRLTARLKMPPVYLQVGFEI